MQGKFKMSHSNHMLSIQIELVIYHQFNSIKLSFFTGHMKRSIPVCTFIIYSYLHVSSIVGGNKLSWKIGLENVISAELFIPICIHSL